MEGWRIGILSLSEESCSSVTLLMHSTHAFSSIQHAELSLLAISAIFVSIIPHQGFLEGRGSKVPFKKRHRYLTYIAKWSACTKLVLRPKIKAVRMFTNANLSSFLWHRVEDFNKIFQVKHEFLIPFPLIFVQPYIFLLFPVFSVWWENFILTKVLHTVYDYF